MIAIMNSLLVNEGAADEVVERFSGSKGHIQIFSGLRFDGSREIGRSRQGSSGH